MFTPERVKRMLQELTTRRRALRTVEDARTFYEAVEQGHLPMDDTLAAPSSVA